jgi:hypothetical protein
MFLIENQKQIGDFPHLSLEHMRKGEKAVKSGFLCPIFNLVWDQDGASYPCQQSMSKGGD